MLDDLPDDTELDKDEFERQAAPLRTRVLELQQRVRESDFAVVIELEGFDGAGRHETMNLLHEWLDPRHLGGEAFEAPDEQERARPEYWRYWLALPRTGRIAMTMGGRYTVALQDAMHGKKGRKRLPRALERIRRFEKMLTDDGTLVIKLWFHMSHARLRKLLAKLERDEDTDWRVTERMEHNAAHYDEVAKLSQRMLDATNTDNAPWDVIAGHDERYRTIEVMKIFVERVEARLARRPIEVVEAERSTPPWASFDVLRRIDLSLAVDDDTYDERLPELQGELHRLSERAIRKGIPVVAAFEGMDAAGKGGAIRRVTAALDARRYRVIRVAAPSEEERGFHYLWRFWRHLPRRGHATIFDRSWYGRVLVERVEGFATQTEWARAYDEINEFEREIVEHGIVLAKFWLQVSQAEQLQRFEERQNTPWKHFKITDEDWRNREKAGQYAVATSEMLMRTSPPGAPWTVVPAEDKRFARLAVLQTMIERLRAAVD